MLGGGSLSDYKLSRYVLKTLLFGNDNRIDFLMNYDSNYYDNFHATSIKEFGRIKDIKIKFGNLLINPENYMRYFCKLKEKKTDIKLLRICYPIISCLIYLYCLGSISLKALILKIRCNND